MTVVVGEGPLRKGIRGRDSGGGTRIYGLGVQVDSRTSKSVRYFASQKSLFIQPRV